MVNSHKVKCLVDEVVTQRLEQTLHQRQTESINTWPAGGVYRLTGERLKQKYEATKTEILESRADNVTQTFPQFKFHLNYKKLTF